MLRRSLVIFSATLVACFVFLGHAAQAGVSYTNPGWRYTYEGTLLAGVDGFPDGFGNAQREFALDGTWRQNQSAQWDGTAPGDPISNPGDPVGAVNTPTGGPAGTSPGGVAALTEASTNYIRLQDAGNPEFFGWTEASPLPRKTNRRVYFGRNMQDDGLINDELVLTNTGVTISFRMRIPNSGPLDDVYFEDTGLTEYFSADSDNNQEVDGRDFLAWQRNVGDTTFLEKSGGNFNKDQNVDGLDLPFWQSQFGNGGAPGKESWLGADHPNGRGTPMNHGRGIINIVQNTFDNTTNLGSNDDTQVSFSLVTSQDVTDFCGLSGGAGALCTGSGSGGLIMNNLNGDAPSNFIDSAAPGTLNILEQTDANLNQWNEYWITLENNGPTPGNGNILVTVYMNGSTTPSDTFNVTLASANNSAYKEDDEPYVEFGVGDGEGFGAFDVDFFSYKLGVTTPIAALSAATAAVPEPASLVSLAIGLIAMAGYTARRRR